MTVGNDLCKRFTARHVFCIRAEKKFLFSAVLNIWCFSSKQRVHTLFSGVYSLTFFNDFPSDGVFDVLFVLFPKCAHLATHLSFSILVLTKMLGVSGLKFVVIESCRAFLTRVSFSSQTFCLYPIFEVF